MKPVGIDPVNVNGIIMRKSVEMPDHLQALYNESTGQILWIGEIGTNPAPGTVHATAVTLSHRNYEAVLQSEEREKIRRRKG